MFYRVRRRVNTAWFDWRCRGILDTPPLQKTQGGPHLVSQVCHRDLIPYLVTVKTAHLHLGAEQITVVDDGTLSTRDQSILVQHIPGIRIVHRNEVRPAKCPKGNVWERLLMAADICQNSYVIQLDADTVTLSEMSEVLECIAAGSSFTLLGGGSSPAVETAAAASRRYAEDRSGEVQSVVERSFCRLQDADQFCYVRGNAGLVGFPRASFSRDTIERLSMKMESLCGELWHTWGSEQVASNLIVANTPRCVPLPFPKYASHWALPGVRYADSAFVHFVGPHRYDDGLYIRFARMGTEAVHRNQGASLAVHS